MMIPKRKTLRPLCLFMIGSILSILLLSGVKAGAQSPPGTAFAALTANITSRTLSDALWEIAEQYYEDPRKIKNPKIPWVDLTAAVYEKAWNVLMKGLVSGELCSAAKKWDGTEKVYIKVTYTVYQSFFSGKSATVEVFYGLGVEGGKIVAYPLQEFDDEVFNTRTGQWEVVGTVWEYDEDGGMKKETWGAHAVVQGDSDPWNVYAAHSGGK